MQASGGGAAARARYDSPSPQGHALTTPCPQTESGVLDKLESRYIALEGAHECPVVDLSHSGASIVVHLDQARTARGGRQQPHAGSQGWALRCPQPPRPGLRRVGGSGDGLRARMCPLARAARALHARQVAGLWMLLGGTVVVALAMVCGSVALRWLRRLSGGASVQPEPEAPRRPPAQPSFWGTTISFARRSAHGHGGAGGRAGAARFSGLAAAE